MVEVLREVFTDRIGQGMKLTVRLADPDGEEIVDIDGRDRRAFERYGRKATGLPLTGSLKDCIVSAPELYSAWLCYNALVVRGKRTEFGRWEEFEARVIECVTDEDIDELEGVFGDPTTPATSAG